MEAGPASIQGMAGSNRPLKRPPPPPAAGTRAVIPLGTRAQLAVRRRRASPLPPLTEHHHRASPPSHSPSILMTVHDGLMRPVTHLLPTP